MWERAEPRDGAGSHADSSGHTAFPCLAAYPGVSRLSLSAASSSCCTHAAPSPTGMQVLQGSPETAPGSWHHCHCCVYTRGASLQHGLSVPRWLRHSSLSKATISERCDNQCAAVGHHRPNTPRVSTRTGLQETGPTQLHDPQSKYMSEPGTKLFSLDGEHFPRRQSKIKQCRVWADRSTQQEGRVPAAGGARCPAYTNR